MCDTVMYVVWDVLKMMLSSVSVLLFCLLWRTESKHPLMGLASWRDPEEENMFTCQKVTVMTGLLLNVIFVIQSSENYK